MSLRIVPSNSIAVKPLVKSVSIPAQMHRLDGSKNYKGVAGPSSLPKHVVEYSKTTHVDA